MTRSSIFLRPIPALTSLTGLLLCITAGATAQTGYSGFSLAPASPASTDRLAHAPSANPFAELAAALIAGPAAVEKLRGSHIAAGRYRLRLTVPMMDECVVTQNELDVACYADRRTEYVAHGVFDTLLVQLRETLSAPAWAEVQREPRGTWIRRVRFRPEESGARIDLDIGRQEGGGFRVWLWGFAASR